MPGLPRVLPLVLLLGLVPPSRAGFVEVAASRGYFGGQPTWGAQIADIDGDGDLDVFNSHHFYSGFVFWNVGAGQLSVWALPQLLTSTADRHGYLWADLDNDAVLDVLCVHGSDGGCGTCTDDGHELWKGDGDGTFTPVPGAGGMYDQIGRGRALAAADLDGDGDLDIYHGKAPAAGSPNSLYRNDGGMAFVEIAPAWGVAEGLGTVGGLFADVDDDGDPDLLVGGDEFERPTVLFRHDGDAFTDVTSVAFAAPPPILAGADFGDYDDDGDLDLIGVQGDEAVFDTWSATSAQLKFFANFRSGDDGVDVFELDASGGNAVASFRYLGGVHPEYFFLGPDAVHPVGSSFALTDAYVGAPSFTPGVDLGLYCWRESPGGRWLLHASGVPGSYGNFHGTVTAAVGGAIVDPSASNLEPLPVPSTMPRLWRNDGGAFTDVSAAAGLPVLLNPRHATWVDFDGDGDLDAHVVVRGSVADGNPPDVLLRNDGASFATLGGPEWAPGLATYLADGGVWGDLDRDGDPDLVLQEGSGPIAFTTACPAVLYRNDGPAGAWLGLDLVALPGQGTVVGAKVDVHAGAVRRHRRLSANSWRGFQPPIELLVGLGEAAAVDSVVVVWPDGTRELFGPFAANTRASLVRGGSPSGAPPAAAVAAAVGALAPQPARGRQALSLVLAADRAVRVRVCDVTGRTVRDLGTMRGRGAAPFQVTWDGRDDAGAPVAAGIYFVIGSGDLTFARKSVRLR